MSRHGSMARRYASCAGPRSFGFQKIEVSFGGRSCCRSGMFDAEDYCPERPGSMSSPFQHIMIDENAEKESVVDSSSSQRPKSVFVPILLATRRMLYATRQRCACERKEGGSDVPRPPHALHVIVITVLSKLAGRVAWPMSHSRVATMMSVGPMMSILRRGVWLRGKVAGVKPSLVERPLRSATFGQASCARNRYAWSGGLSPDGPRAPVPDRSAARISTVHLLLRM
ncbi:hypothetical protein CALVIDRAFT_168900 [Calocera viscosa TUFC12733]|uniref:Uncharacterized protein n=1 Tax=Calocera viscosa (strain TUFC12733) TaxID=1330018 RepID=A0A167L6V4_CALVF|nr:hypothetical protein CALVIDRAFT_168900 [Calocera viscosa TUFC12733]